MPESVVGWAMFAFFGIGATGGWVVLAILVLETWKSFRKVRG